MEAEAENGDSTHKQEQAVNDFTSDEPLISTNIGDSADVFKHDVTGGEEYGGFSTATDTEAAAAQEQFQVCIWHFDSGSNYKNKIQSVKLKVGSNTKTINYYRRTCNWRAIAKRRHLLRRRRLLQSLASIMTTPPINSIYRKSCHRTSPNASWASVSAFNSPPSNSMSAPWRCLPVSLTIRFE